MPALHAMTVLAESYHQRMQTNWQTHRKRYINKSIYSAAENN